MKRHIAGIALLLIALVVGNSAQSETTKPTSQDLLAALGHVKVISQEIKKSGSNHSVMVQIKNESDLGFGWVTVSCRIMRGNDFVDVAEAYITNLQPGETAGEQASYTATPDNSDADRAICRPAIGL